MCAQKLECVDSSITKQAKPVMTIANFKKELRRYKNFN